MKLAFAVPVASQSEWSWIDPWFLAIVPVVWLVLAWRLLQARAGAALPTPDITLLRDLPRTLRARLWMAPLVVSGLALTALAVALARPVMRDVLPLREKGVDIVLTLDISSSMMAADLDSSKPRTRMHVAREKALEFAKARVHDRVGLLTFARFPELRCPMTLDQDALAAFLRTVETVPERSPENKTGIGVAVAKAVTLFEESEAKSRIVVLLSDGEENVWNSTVAQFTIHPEDAAKLAKDAGVVVHCIGVGRAQEINDPFFGRRTIPKPEFQSLKTIAKVTGGVFFEAESADELTDVYEKINEMEKVELEDPRFRTIDLYLYPFAAGALLLLLQLILEFAWIRRVP